MLKTVITADNKKTTSTIKELIPYRDLIWLLVKRNFTLIYKQTILGPLWLILTPLMTSVVFTFVFGGLAGISTDGVPQILFYMAGNVLWTLFNSTTTNIANTFIGNVNLLSKVYFPRLVIPIAQAITGLINFCIQFIIFFILHFYYVLRDQVSFCGLAVLALPFLIIHTLALSMAIGIILASLTIKYRDMAIAVSFIMQLWMYATPVVYPLSITGGMMKTVLLLNPVTGIINNFRYVLLGTGEMMWGGWIYSIVVTVALLVFGVKIYQKTERNFVDTI